MPPELTAIGHSYGSLTTGLALQEPGNHGVTNAIFYGSPGIEATTPEQLHLQAGHVFTMETPDDPIQMVYAGPPLTHLGAAALPPPLNVLAESTLGALDATGAGQFGPNPATNPNFTHLATGPAVVPDGLGGSGSLSLEGAHGHSDYPRFSCDGLPRTTNYNIAAVIAVSVTTRSGRSRRSTNDSSNHARPPRTAQCSGRGDRHHDDRMSRVPAKPAHAVHRGDESA